MRNQDWENFGREIKKTVQDAIDSRDYAKLNQTITNTINKATEGIQNGYKYAAQNRKEK